MAWHVYIYHRNWATAINLGVNTNKAKTKQSIKKHKINQNKTKQPPSQTKQPTKQKSKQISQTRKAIFG